MNHVDHKILENNAPGESLNGSPVFCCVSVEQNDLIYYLLVQTIQMNVVSKTKRRVGSLFPIIILSLTSETAFQGQWPTLQDT